MRQEIQQQLFAYAEEEYRAFQEKLLPGVAHMMGVRLPKLRAIDANAGHRLADSVL